MNMHKNARLTPRGRERIVRQVESGQTPETVAEAAAELKVCERTLDRWRKLEHVPPELNRQDSHGALDRRFYWH